MADLFVCFVRSSFLGKKHKYTCTSGTQGKVVKSGHQYRIKQQQQQHILVFFLFFKLQFNLQ